MLCFNGVWIALKGKTFTRNNIKFFVASYMGSLGSFYTGVLCMQMNSFISEIKSGVLSFFYFPVPSSTEKLFIFLLQRFF